MAFYLMQLINSKNWLIEILLQTSTIDAYMHGMESTQNSDILDLSSTILTLLAED